MEDGRIIPLLKKGDKTDICNYRPISNICSLAKVYEKCIQNELSKIEEINHISLTGNEQHGFKKGLSTVTLGLQLQHNIASYLEVNNVVGLVSIDLTAAFDTICKAKLIKRLIAMGQEPRLVNLIKIWLSERYAYTECDGETSYPYPERWGAPQGSVLGPTLFAIYMRPLFDVCDGLTMYADDNYFLASGESSTDVKQKLEHKLNKAADWLENSELVINFKKTEFVLFSNKSVEELTLQFKDHKIKNSKTMNILGIVFDEKLKWSAQINSVINNAKRDNFRLISLRKFFNEYEMAKILTSLIFSRFYYGSIVWYNPFVSKKDKNRLLSTSCYLIKSAYNLKDWKFVSRDDIHSLSNRATPDKMSDYVT